MDKFRIREEIPVKSFSVAVFICKIIEGRSKYLIIKRSSKTLHGSWQMVSGKLEKGENAVEAVLREVKEETGLIPNRLYSANLVEQFYDTDYNVINLVPVFLAFVNDEANVILNPAEHSEYKWLSANEAETYLIFENQVKNLREIEENFIKGKPNKYLEIPLNQYL